MELDVTTLIIDISHEDQIGPEVVMANRLCVWLRYIYFHLKYLLLLLMRSYEKKKLVEQLAKLFLYVVFHFIVNTRFDLTYYSS